MVDTAPPDEAEILGAAVAAPGDDFGFDIDEAEVIYWGCCPACQKAPVAAGQEP